MRTWLAICCRVGAHIFIEKGAMAHPASVGEIPRETTKTKDITGGLRAWPNCLKQETQTTSLQRNRRPKFLRRFREGQRKVLVDNKVGDVKEYFIRRAKATSTSTRANWVERV